MSDSFVCPYCDHVFPINNDTYTERKPSFLYNSRYDNQVEESEFIVAFFKCPKCGEYTIRGIGTGEKVKSDVINIKPNSLAKQFPEYVPEPIRNDYEESYAIVSLSPKASATLSRRCLQGMIRDFWNINEKNLYTEISALKNKIPVTQWKVLDGIRKLGNIGAHMEQDINTIVDIDPNEAEKLLKVIEKLINDWYIERYETEKLYQDILDISNEKQDQRKGK